jgi:hypothetical protein
LENCWYGGFWILSVTSRVKVRGGIWYGKTKATRELLVKKSNIFSGLFDSRILPCHQTHREVFALWWLAPRMNVVFWRGHVHSEWWPPPEKAYRQDKQQGLVCIMRHKYSVTWYMCKSEGYSRHQTILISLFTQGESTVATTRTKQSTVRATTIGRCCRVASMWEPRVCKSLILREDDGRNERFAKSSDNAA